MKIILAITDSKGKSLVFATDTLQAYSLDEVRKFVEQRKVESVHIAQTGQGSYLRTNPNTAENDNLDILSISANRLYLLPDNFTHLLSQPTFMACKNYLEKHCNAIEESDAHIMYIEKRPLMTREQLSEKLTPHHIVVFDAADQFSIDPYMLGAILIDEIVRAHPWEDLMDKLSAVFAGRDTSCGIAQVTIKTARELIQKNYYNPNPDDEKLAPENVTKTSFPYLYAYIIQPRHSIHFAAARIRQIIDYWEHKTDLSDRPEIIGTLYSQGLGTPKTNPVANERGLQIAQEFYLLAQAILKP